MQRITIYTVEREEPIAIEVERVTGGTKQGGLKDTLGFEDKDGNKGWIYINHDRVIAGVVAPSIGDDA